MWEPNIRNSQTALWFMLVILGVILSFVGWYRWAT